ncbi:MAG: winged helix-turn-helix transcriptional regulator [Candidatus Diapherotrites archaeon]|nr:winged helix-turn-helix transcriptional regulator [Candidatus Diapherotrites archaeon]
MELSKAVSRAYLEVLKSLKHQPKRFSEVKQDTDRTDKTVSNVLKSAEDAELVEKKGLKKGGDVFIAYTLTKKGNRFIREMTAWEEELK